ncbi:M56 family metallopeptidase [Mycolicibacterium mageritense]|uniref:Peptidase M48 domain-containing protein n=1 Tax=Mycolicibacterium mageritense TaxID=53462 RepID=A0AAI8TXY6_MYCME|nr:M56 family metallopeptidase [Mycolicibacterium mageritense]BDY30545.1 hypothetical protein hbim_04489 [Mycolicibacterium mageritense]
MNAGICLLVYGVVLVWGSPVVLTRFGRGMSPGYAVTVWLTTIVLAVGAWIAAAASMLRELLIEDAAVPVKFCLDMLLALNHFGWPGRLTLAAVSAAASAISAVVLWRLVKSVQRLWSRSREHAHAAHVLGTPTARPGVVTLPADHAAAYCVAGRPDAIVVTTGALAALDEPELAAVLAHEQAHLAGRHPQLMMALRALALAMPRLPLFTAAVGAVGRLVEMCADDSAARRHGRETLLCGLVSLADSRSSRPPALGAADTEVLARASRLATPAMWGARLRERILLSVVLAAVVLAPPVITFWCHA